MKRNLIICTVSVMFLAVGCTQNGKVQNEPHDLSTNTQNAMGGTDLAPKPSVMLGVNMAPSGPIMSKHLGVDGESSTLIIEVGENTPASKAGLELWDVIVTVYGSDDASPRNLRRILRASKPGDTVLLEVLRGTEKVEITVVLEEADHERMIPLPAGTPGT